MLSFAFGIELRSLLADALDRRDVAAPERELSGDLRVVDEVHVRRGGGDAPAQRDEHVVRPDDPALLGDTPLHLRNLEREDVAGPCHARCEVTRRQRLGVVVAVEAPDLPGVLGLLDNGKRSVECRIGDLCRIVAVLEHDQAQRVAHGVPNTDLALELRVLEKLRDRRHGFGELLVPRDAVHPGEPGQAVVTVRIERRARLRVDEIRDVRNEALVELQRPVVRDVLAQEAVVVGGDDDVAVDAVPA